MVTFENGQLTVCIDGCECPIQCCFKYSNTNGNVTIFPNHGIDTYYIPNISAEDLAKLQTAQATLCGHGVAGDITVVVDPVDPTTCERIEGANQTFNQAKITNADLLAISGGSGIDSVAISAPDCDVFTIDSGGGTQELGRKCGVVNTKLGENDCNALGDFCINNPNGCDIKVVWDAIV